MQPLNRLHNRLYLYLPLAGLHKVYIRVQVKHTELSPDFLQIHLSADQ